MSMDSNKSHDTNLMSNLSERFNKRYDKRFDKEFNEEFNRELDGVIDGEMDMTIDKMNNNDFEGQLSGDDNYMLDNGHNVDLDDESDKEFNGELEDDLDTIIGSDIYRGLNGRKNLTDIIQGSQIDSSSPLINKIINNDYARIPASLYGERSNSITDFEKDTIEDNSSK